MRSLQLTVFMYKELLHMGDVYILKGKMRYLQLLSIRQQNKLIWFRRYSHSLFHHSRIEKMSVLRLDERSRGLDK